MARDRPSGDGIAPNISVVVERSRTEALPSSVILSSALPPSGVFPATKKLFPSAAHVMLSNSFRPVTRTSRVLPVSVERKRIVSLRLGQTRARCEPSGDKLQLHAGSTCDGYELLPFFTSNRNVSMSSPLATLYRQKFNGEFAHCTFQMPTCLRTRRGAPPPIGMAKSDDGVSRLADLGVEIYKISEPSGVTLGCLSCSALVVKPSAKG